MTYSLEWCILKIRHTENDLVYKLAEYFWVFGKSVSADNQLIAYKVEKVTVK
jgi:hypothetical protein